MGSAKCDHHMECGACRNPIIGTRYQCANCPTAPGGGFSICSDCEPRSYLVHNARHIFFKLPRPVDRPIDAQYPILPILYKKPAGPIGVGVPPDSMDPKAYLRELCHNAAVCDRCIQRICGEWFRCVYCAKDLCDVCEGLDTHDRRHFFLIFKAPVDMQVFRVVAELDNPNGSPPVLKYPVYFS